MAKIGSQVLRLKFIYRGYAVFVWDAVEGAVCCGKEHQSDEKRCRVCGTHLRHRKVTLVGAQIDRGVGRILGRSDSLQDAKIEAIRMVDEYLGPTREDGPFDPDQPDEIYDAQDDPPDDPPDDPLSDRPTLRPPSPTGPASDANKQMTEKIVAAGWPGKAEAIWRDEDKQRRISAGKGK